MRPTDNPNNIEKYLTLILTKTLRKPFYFYWGLPIYLIFFTLFVLKDNFWHNLENNKIQSAIKWNDGRIKNYLLLLLFLKGLDKILKVLQFKFYMFLKESVIFFSKRCYGLYWTVCLQTQIMVIKWFLDLNLKIFGKYSNLLVPIAYCIRSVAIFLSLYRIFMGFLLISSKFFFFWDTVVHKKFCISTKFN